MKKNIDSKLALYPMLVALIGAMNEDKPTWTLVAHMGIIGHDRVLVSLASAHFINGLIKKNGKLSINLVSEEMLPKADVAGSVSGNQTDKSALFDWEVEGAGAPILSDSPLSMECTVEDIYNTPNFESFICSVDATYVEERHCGADGKINYQTLKPVLFDFPNYEYLRTGDVVGKCLTFRKK